jgi:hypothetical protein
VGPGVFNIFSVPGIVWAHLMSNTISGVVMLSLRRSETWTIPWKRPGGCPAPAIWAR